jgi:Family of unknown function (DUF5999)
MIMKCPHQPPCPAADAPDCEAACVVAAHPEQGWSLLCNGVVVFEDTGDLLPDGRIIAPHRDELDIELVPVYDLARSALTPRDGHRVGARS